jgi:hypothetical protein
VTATADFAEQIPTFNVWFSSQRGRGDWLGKLAESYPGAQMDAINRRHPDMRRAEAEYFDFVDRRWRESQLITAIGVAPQTPRPARLTLAELVDQALALLIHHAQLTSELLDHIAIMPVERARRLQRQAGDLLAESVRLARAERVPDTPTEEQP